MASRYEKSSAKFKAWLEQDRKRRAAAKPKETVEEAFRSLCKSKYPTKKLIHKGWPDFFLTEDDGSYFAVEVKSRLDRLSKGQTVCFGALERAGIQVYIWQPHRPDVITKWRAWWKANPTLRPDDDTRFERAARQERKRIVRNTWG